MPAYRDERIDSSNSKIIRWFKVDQFEPERAVTSYFVSPKTLLLIRIPIVLYSMIVMWADIGTSIADNEFKHYFAFFTRFTFVGLHAYLVTSFCHHVRYLWCQPSHPASFFNQSAILNYLYVWLYHTVVTFNILTPVVYWGLLSGTLLNDPDVTSMDWWVGVSLHAATFFMMMIEVILTRMVLYTRMVWLVFGTVMCYMMLTFIIYGTEKWWVYSFLDWSQGPSAAIWYIAVALFVVICFFLQIGIHALRNKIGAPRRMVDDDETIMPAEEKGYAIDKSQHQELEIPQSNNDKRYYSQTLVDSSLESHITLGASSTDHLA